MEIIIFSLMFVGLLSITAELIEAIITHFRADNQNTKQIKLDLMLFALIAILAMLLGNYYFILFCCLPLALIIGIFTWRSRR